LAAIAKEARVPNPPSGSFSAQPVLSLAKEWNRDNLRAVVFVQARASRRILGAATLQLSSTGKVAKS
jgi:hypothetical protein